MNQPPNTEKIMETLIRTVGDEPLTEQLVQCHLYIVIDPKKASFNIMKNRYGWSDPRVSLPIGLLRAVLEEPDSEPVISWV